MPANFRTGIPGYANGDGVRQKFTQKERDNETGLDYFLARYYSSNQGRFTSPDEFAGGPTELFAHVAPHNPTFYSEIAEPQSLNKYQYCLNNPLRYVDPDGHQTTTADDVWKPASGGAIRVVQGTLVHAGVTLAQDSHVRTTYTRAVSALSGPEASATRSALKAEARQRLTPLGRGLSEAADKSRVGQLAGKSASELAESASRTSAFWNNVAKGSEGASRFALVAGVGISTYNIATAPEGQRGETIASEAGAWVGAVAGGKIGAYVGGGIGTAIEPVGGTAVGAIIGGVVGAGAGAIGGSNLGTALYNGAGNPTRPQTLIRSC